MKTFQELQARVVPNDEVNWRQVQLLVEIYTDRHPEEIAGCIEVVKQKRAQLTNKFGLTSEENEMRHLYELPPNLYAALTYKWPKVLTDKNLRHFLRTYPIFCVAEKL